MLNLSGPFKQNEKKRKKAKQINADIEAWKATPVADKRKAFIYFALSISHLSILHFHILSIIFYLSNYFF